MADWSERELEDALWEDASLVWPWTGFRWIGRQVPLGEGRLDLLGMGEFATGRCLCVVELKACRAGGNALVQIQNYIAILNMQLATLPSRAYCALAEECPIFGILVAPQFTRRVVVSASYFTKETNIFLRQAISPTDLRVVVDDAEHKLWERDIPAGVVRALSQPVLTSDELRSVGVRL